MRGWMSVLWDRTSAFVIYPSQTSAKHYNLKVPSAMTNNLAFGLIDRLAHWNKVVVTP